MQEDQLTVALPLGRVTLPCSVSRGFTCLGRIKKIGGNRQPREAFCSATTFLLLDCIFPILLCGSREQIKNAKVLLPLYPSRKGRAIYRPGRAPDIHTALGSVMGILPVRAWKFAGR